MPDMRSLTIMGATGAVVAAAVTALATGAAGTAPGARAAQPVVQPVVQPVAQAVREAVVQAAALTLPAAAATGDVAVPHPRAVGAVVRVAVKAPAVRKPTAKRERAHAVHASPRATSRSLTRRPSGGGLMGAVARIPGYSSHAPTRWVATSRYGHYGATDLGTGVVYVNPSVPSSLLDSVVRHEWSHVLTMRVYGGNVSAALAGTRAVFGGSGITGAERAADCMAIRLGATWTHYTSCSDPAWRAAAGRLLAGRRP